MEEDRKEQIRQWKAGGETQNAIARKLGISRQRVSQIARESNLHPTPFYRHHPELLALLIYIGLTESLPPKQQGEWGNRRARILQQQGLVEQVGRNWRVTEKGLQRLVDEGGLAREVAGVLLEGP